jgi:hypothetical protein
MFGSTCHLKSLEELKKTITNMHNHLKPNGVILIAPWFSEHDFSDGNIRLITAENEIYKIAYMYTRHREKRIARLKVHILVGSTDGVRHISQELENYLFNFEDYSEAFSYLNMRTELIPKYSKDKDLYIASK